MTDRYVRNPAVEESPLQEELMLFETGSSRFFVLNRTMAFIWKRCENEASFDDIRSSVQAGFAGAEGAPVVDDVRAALDGLVGLKLVTVV